MRLWYLRLGELPEGFQLPPPVAPEPAAEGIAPLPPSPQHQQAQQLCHHVIAHIPQGTAAWLEARKGHVGASTCSILVGLGLPLPADALLTKEDAKGRARGAANGSAKDDALRELHAAMTSLMPGGVAQGEAGSVAQQDMDECGRVMCDWGTM